jgi:hypothetical protein
MSHQVEPDSIFDATHGRNGSALPVVDRLLEEARGRLSLRSGGAPLCSTTPTMPDHGASLKSLEGAVVALTRLRTEVLDETTVRASTVAERCLQAWKSENEHRHGSAWTDYTAGGARALSDALGKLDRVEPTSDDAPHQFSNPRSPVEPHPRGSTTSTSWRRWSPRRAVVTSTLVATLSTSLLLRSAQTPQASAWATAAGLAALILASGALSTLLPAQGPLRHVHLGCGPCAAVGGLLALGSAWLTLANPGVLGSATLSLGAAGFALVQRLTEPSTCPTATPPTPADKPSETDPTNPPEAQNRAR